MRGVQAIGECRSIRCCITAYRILAFSGQLRHKSWVVLLDKLEEQGSSGSVMMPETTLTSMKLIGGEPGKPATYWLFEQVQWGTNLFDMSVTQQNDTWPLN